jgi:hypothetical protein
MKRDLGAALRPAAQSDTIPILNAGSVSRTPSVVHDKRGGCQTPKASNILLQSGGLPSFEEGRRHHRTPAHRPLHGDPRLPSSHGITGICEAVWGSGNALCRAGKRSEKAKRNRTISISTIPQTQKTFLVGNTRRRGVF